MVYVQEPQKIANILQSMDQTTFYDILMWLSFKKHTKISINYADTQEHDSYKKWCT